MLQVKAKKAVPLSSPLSVLDCMLEESEGFSNVCLARFWYLYLSLLLVDGKKIFMARLSDSILFCSAFTRPSRSNLFRDLKELFFRISEWSSVCTFRVQISILKSILLSIPVDISTYWEHYQCCQYSAFPIFLLFGGTRTTCGFCCRTN